MKKLHKHIYKLIFFLASFIYLGFYCQDFLYQVGWRNYFLSNTLFMVQTLNQSAGALIYLSRFLNQIFAYPIVSSVFISCLLTIIVFVYEKIFDKNYRALGWSFLPSLLLLFIIGRAGTAIYARFEIGVFFSMIIGTLWSLFVYLLYQKSKESLALKIALLSLNLLLIPLIAIFSVIPIMMIGVAEAKYCRSWNFLIGGLLLYLLLTFLSCRYLYVEMFSHSVFMPFPNVKYGALFASSVVLALFLILSPIFENLSIKQFEHKSCFFKNLPALALMCLVFLFSFRDMHGRTLLKCSRICDTQDWKTLKEKTRDIIHPTMGVNAYRIIALANLDQLQENLFDIQMPFSVSTIPYVQEELVYETDLFFYASFLAVSYQHNMDEWVTNGENFRGLKNMALIAILRDNDELASRYIRLMKQSFFLKSYAQEYQTYLLDKETMYKKHPLWKKMKENEPLEDIPQVVFAHLAEFYLSYQIVQKDNLQRTIMADLYVRDVETALSNYQIIKNKKRLYQYMSEAAVIYAMKYNDDRYIKALNVDPLVINRVFACMKEYRSLNGNDKNEAFYKKYKGMYTLFYLTDFHGYRNLKNK